jgi:hypothetical protein
LQEELGNKYIMDNFQPQPRVNAKVLPKYVGHTVLLMGEVVDGGVVRASDGGNVVVHLPPGESFDR